MWMSVQLWMKEDSFDADIAVVATHTYGSLLGSFQMRSKIPTKIWLALDLKGKLYEWW